MANLRLFADTNVVNDGKGHHSYHVYVCDLDCWTFVNCELCRDWQNVNCIFLFLLQNKKLILKKHYKFYVMPFEIIW